MLKVDLAIALLESETEVGSLMRRFDEPQKHKPFVNRCMVRGVLDTRYSRSYLPSYPPIDKSVSSKTQELHTLTEAILKESQNLSHENGVAELTTLTETKNQIRLQRPYPRTHQI